MKKILQILPSDSPGILQLAQSIERSFPSKNYTVTTAFLNKVTNPHVSNTAIFLNFEKNDTQGLKIKVLWALFKYCRLKNFDVIITHRFKPLYLMLIISKLLQIPTCLSVIHGFSDFSRGSRRCLLKVLWSDNWHFVAISGAVANYLARLTPKIGRDKITTIDNAINVAKLVRSLKTKDQSYHSLGLTGKPFIFGTIGRLVPLKEHLSLIKAFQIVLRKKPNAHLIIIGEGRCRTMLDNYLSSHNLHEKVTLTGHLDNASQYLSAFDIFILPSSQEGFGIVLLEAMAAKCPIIASRVGGIPYVLGQLGHLIPHPSTIHELANIMLEKSNMSPVERNKEGDALYQRLLEMFDEPVYQQKWLALIKQKVKT